MCFGYFGYFGDCLGVMLLCWLGIEVGIDGVVADVVGMESGSMLGS